MHWIEFIHNDLLSMQHILLLIFYTLNCPAAFWNFNIYAKQLLKDSWNKFSRITSRLYTGIGLIKWGNGSSLEVHTEWKWCMCMSVHVKYTHIHRWHKDLCSWNHQCKCMHLRYLFFPWSGIIMHSHIPQVLNISDLIEWKDVRSVNMRYLYS